MELGTLLGQLGTDRMAEAMRTDQGFPLGRDESGSTAGALQRRGEEVEVRQQLAIINKQILGEGASVTVTKATFPTFERLELPNRFRSLVVEGNQAFLFGFACRNAQARCAIRIRVQTVQFQAPNFSPACATPAGNQQGSALKGTRQLPNAVISRARSS